MSQVTTTGTEKAGRNDPCPCGSGKKFKKCCGFQTQPVVAPAPAVLSPTEMLAEARSQLDSQLAKYAPTVTIDAVETKIREAQKTAISGPKTAPMQVIESIFSDDNLMLKNKRHAERLFRAFMSLWNTIAEIEKN